MSFGAGDFYRLGCSVGAPSRGQRDSNVANRGRNMACSSESVRETDFAQRVEAALERAPQSEAELHLPTILMGNREFSAGSSGRRVEDRAVEWFSQQGLLADRTRANAEGYPGLLRELESAAPWVEVEPEDVSGTLSPERREELRPLYQWAASEDAELLALFNAHLDERDAVMATLGMQKHPGRRSFEGARLQAIMSLARVLGAEGSMALLDVVFDHRDLDGFGYGLAVGAPDLLVWHPNPARGLWFFVEVKGPGDCLRPTQYAWLRRSWPFVCGHMLLLATV